MIKDSLKNGALNFEWAQLRAVVWYQHNLFVRMESEPSAIFAVAHIPPVHGLIVQVLCFECRRNNNLCVAQRHKDAVTVTFFEQYLEALDCVSLFTSPHKQFLR